MPERPLSRVEAACLWFVIFLVLAIDCSHAYLRRDRFLEVEPNALARMLYVTGGLRLSIGVRVATVLIGLLSFVCVPSMRVRVVYGAAFASAAVGLTLIQCLLMP